MTSFEKINNKALSPRERINQALDMLHPPYQDEEQFYAALTYLSYRELEDELVQDIDIHLTGIEPPKITHPGLKVRWEISIEMVEVYNNVKLNRLDRVKSKAQKIKHVFETQGDLWPACICNYLRSQLILSQVLINQDHKGEAVYILSTAVNAWRECISRTNFFAFPYRATEMREDCNEIQAMIFTLRDLGEIEDKREFDWMTKQKVFKTWRKEMQDAMQKLNWKY